MADAKIRILIVDDHPIVVEGLTTLMEGQPDLEVVGTAENGADALELFTKLKPDVTLMDLRMPGMTGPEAIVALRKKHPAASVIVLTTYDREEDIFRVMAAGAKGFLLKTTFPDGIREAIRKVHAGGTLLAPELAARLAVRSVSPGLTERELGVLRLLSDGLSNKEIGAALFISEDTVKDHVSRIFVKLGVSDRTEAVFTALQRGILALK
jgi:two-component system, NarL family, response regulator